jgi:thiamine monophosphate synthase
VAAAGAPRVVVVRAIRDAPEPRVAAAGLRAALEETSANVE